MSDPRLLQLRLLSSLGTRLAAGAEGLKAARKIARDLHAEGMIPDSVKNDVERALGRVRLALGEVALQLGERGAGDPEAEP